MAYRKDNYDPNYQMGGEDLRRHRRVTLTTVPFFLVVTMINMTSHDGAPWAKWTLQAAWAFYVIVIVLILTGGAYRLWAGDELKILEDETAIANRASAMQWGWVVMVVLASILWFILPFTPSLEAREVVLVLILAGIVTTTLRFVLLEKDDGDEE